MSEAPSLTPAWRHLVVNCALAGEIAEARECRTTLQHLHPGISLKWVDDVGPWVRDEDRKRYSDGLRLAGLA